MTQIKRAAIAGAGFGLLTALYLGFAYSKHAAITGAPLAAITFGTAIYFFVNSKMVKRQTAIKPAAGETIIYQGGANHFKNGEAVGGRLYLLKNKLQFQSHAFNVQNHGLIIELDHITEIGLYNVSGFVPTGLAITVENGKQEKFVVNDRKSWKQHIEKLQTMQLSPFS